MKVRRAAVAGQFYPGQTQRLRDEVNNYIKAAGQVASPGPKAVVAPHAGYIYSGPVAGTAYAYLGRSNGKISRVILLGPAHRVAVRSLATSGAEAFATPLGEVPLDRPAIETLLELPQVVENDAAHAQEHSLEVHLPFLQIVFSDFSVVPLVVGGATAAETAGVLAKLWGGPETAIVISSDLSHYHDYQTARMIDEGTSKSIEALKPLSEGQACGRNAINGLLLLAAERRLRVKTMDLRNSGDTAGPRDRVVGYGAFGFWEEEDKK